MHYWATKSVQHGADAYMYYFTHQPLGAELGAFHAAEIVYAFNNVSYTPAFGSGPNPQLAREISDYWVTFATHGNPNGAAPGIWPAYSVEAKDYMEFGTPGSAPARGLMRDSYSVFERLYQQER
jgi:para-nitrobenzyl esterase